MVPVFEVLAHTTAESLQPCVWQLWQVGTGTPGPTDFPALTALKCICLVTGNAPFTYIEKLFSNLGWRAISSWCREEFPGKQIKSLEPIIHIAASHSREVAAATQTSISPIRNTLLRGTTLAPGWHGLGWPSAYSHAVVPARLLHAMRVNSYSIHHVCIPSSFSHNWPLLCTVSWVHITARYVQSW
jgi:hypothetical protein